MITPRQLEALAAIDRLGTRPPPSLRELGVELLVSHEQARRLVAALAHHHPPLVTLSRGVHRSLRITTDGRAVLEQLGAPAAAPTEPEDDRAWRNRYVFAHPRAAIRVWARHRDGERLDRARRGPGGRAPGVEDVARVGRVLASYTGPQVGDLIAWARTGAGGSLPQTKALIERVSARLAALKIVELPFTPLRVLRSSWIDQDGETRATIATLAEISCPRAEPGGEMGAGSETCARPPTGAAAPGSDPP